LIGIKIYARKLLIVYQKRSSFAGLITKAKAYNAKNAWLGRGRFVCIIIFPTILFCVGIADRRRS
jgi:hypothetical protein